jgi:hypothetical protein
MAKKKAPAKGGSTSKSRSEPSAEAAALQHGATKYGIDGETAPTYLAFACLQRRFWLTNFEWPVVATSASHYPKYALTLSKLVHVVQ